MAELKGIADTHAHLMAHLGYGTRIFWGKPWDPSGISAALKWCTPSHGPGGTDILHQTEFFHYEEATLNSMGGLVLAASFTSKRT